MLKQNKVKPDTQQIEILIEKYLEANTSIQEETLLINYFTSNRVEEHLKPYQNLFSYFLDAKSETLSLDIKIKSIKNTRKWLISGIAASFTLIIGGFWYHNYQEQKQVEKTLADTKMALELIAKQFQKADYGINQLKNVDIATKKAFRNQHTDINQ